MTIHHVPLMRADRILSPCPLIVMACSVSVDYADRPHIPQQQQVRNQIKRYSPALPSAGNSNPVFPLGREFFNMINPGEFKNGVNGGRS